jgi:hypothetical protein
MRMKGISGCDAGQTGACRGQLSSGWADREKLAFGVMQFASDLWGLYSLNREAVRGTRLPCRSRRWARPTGHR